MSNEDAEILITKAEKKLKSFSLFGLFKKDNYKYAADLYKRAGYIYKAKLNWNMCAKCFVKLSELYRYLKHYKANEYLLIAAKVANKFNVNHSIKLYENYIENEYSDKNISKIYGELAGICSRERLYDKAVHYYKLAYEEGDLQNSKYSVMKYLEELCSIYIKTNNYIDAGNTFLKLEDYYKVYAKKYLLIAMLCFLNHDLSITKIKFDEKSDNMDLRDVKAVSNLIKAFESKNNYKLSSIDYDYLSIRASNHIVLVNNLNKKINAFDTTTTGFNEGIGIDSDGLL